MSLLKHIEENVEHLYALIKHVAATQEAAHGSVVQETKDLLEKIEEHMGVAKPAEPIIEAPVIISAPVVISAPSDTNVITMSVTPATVPIEAPQTVAQEQSASNVAN